MTALEKLERKQEAEVIRRSWGTVWPAAKGKAKALCVDPGAARAAVVRGPATTDHRLHRPRHARWLA